MIRSAMTAGLAALVAIALLLIGGRPLVQLIFGAEFLGAFPILMVLIIAPVIAIFSFPLPSMLYVLDRPDAPLKARLVGTIVYFSIIAPLSWRFGVMGAATAFVVGYASMALMLALQVRSEYRRVRTRPA
jgi:O-antigen/teichoic acid export membrane protein